MSKNLNDSISSANSSTNDSQQSSPVPKIGDASIKQGSYGKVLIHKHSKLGQLKHIDEVFAVLKYLV
jgi:hypothetical protein